MTKITREERLQNLLKAEEAGLPRLLNCFLHERRTVKLGYVLTGIASRSTTRGISAYFMNGDIAGLKQHFHVASKLILAAIDLEGGPTFNTGSEIWQALLSDNSEIINAIACVETATLLKDRHNPLRSPFQVHMLQLAILGDYESLQAKVEKLAKNGRKGDRELAAAGQDFFTLLMRGDKQSLEDLVTQHARIRSDDPLTEDFMSYLGTLEAKLCWFKGIKVQIDSPLLPMALMPIAPLAHYDDMYDFLQPGWVPPPQGLMEKVSHWLKK